MHFPNTNGQAQQYHSQVAKPQRLNQAWHISPPNLPLPPSAVMVVFCLRLGLRL